MSNLLLTCSYCGGLSRPLRVNSNSTRVCADCFKEWVFSGEDSDHQRTEWKVMPKQNALIVPCDVNPKRVGVAVVVRLDGKILTCERQHCRDMNDTWQFPGGGVEDKESAFQAMMRELYEETGITTASSINAKFLSVGIGVTPDGNPHVTTFYVLDFDHEPKVTNKEPDKHGDWEWVTPEEFLSRPIIELTRRVVEDLK